MTVSERERIDQLAVGSDGRLLLAMTEDRDYGQGADQVLAEDFRHKLDAYLAAVHSGDVRRMAEQAGASADNDIEIVLFSATEPAPAVIAMLDAVGATPGQAGITARWEPLNATEISAELYERAIVDETVTLLGSDWQFAILWVFAVGHEAGGGIQVKRSDDTVDNLQASETLRELLFEYKQFAHDPVAGTWLSGRIHIAAPDRHQAEFSRDSLPEWVPAPTAEAVRQELADYPRAADEIPTWIRELLA
ncbi:hypothetical protein [Nocardia higoensis]|uniref:hypothetical protein n=1 Tax=Nocardia higoensis TaxID=228599 RepID=UPI00031F8E19|nr:hypothetical protein [Nocardia higoensis]